MYTLPISGQLRLRFTIVPSSTFNSRQFLIHLAAWQPHCPKKLSESPLNPPNSSSLWGYCTVNKEQKWRQESPEAGAGGNSLQPVGRSWPIKEQLRNTTVQPGTLKPKQNHKYSIFENLQPSSCGSSTRFLPVTRFLYCSCSLTLWFDPVLLQFDVWCRMSKKI